MLLRHQDLHNAVCAEWWKHSPQDGQHPCCPPPLPAPFAWPTPGATPDSPTQPCPARGGQAPRCRAPLVGYTGGAVAWGGRRHVALPRERHQKAVGISYPLRRAASPVILLVQDRLVSQAPTS